MAANTYKYTAIVAPKTVRLMHLHPGLETDPICLTLITTALESAPEFEAISYCWGSTPDERRVTCNGTALSITHSLFTGLVHFRYADRPRILWADAICINQADVVEKSAQVLLMPHIYSQATRTIIWLGVADDPIYGAVSPGVAESISQALQLLPEYEPENAVDTATKKQALHRESQRLSEEGKPNLLDHDWTLLAALLGRPWFRRKWVVQEVALAKQAVLYVGGGVEIQWPDLAQLAFTMEGMGIHRLLSLETGKTVLESITIPLHCITNVLMVQIFRTRGTLVDGIVNTMDFECTDSRDHVYSLLSLGAVGPTILPDYGASVCEVFQRFAIAMLVQGQSLKLLSLAPDRSGFDSPGTQRLEALPSWVPDLQLVRSDVMISYTVRPQAFFAGGRGRPIVSISDDRRILRCQGRVIDTVKTFSTSLVEMTLADLPHLRLSPRAAVDTSPELRKKRLVRWLEDNHQLAFGHRTSAEISNPDTEVMMSFYRTMVCGIDIMRNRLPPELIAAFPQYVQWATERAAGNQDGNGQRPSSMLNYSAVIDESIITCTSWLKFCITGHGRFGQIPSGSQPGDCVCVLVGGEVPFIVRPTGRGTYTFVGECYIDGVMDGETFAGEPTQTEPPETLHFE
ncbi:hypothetical protein ANO14919_116560 [Xylariales sp. No.14919]|nr:hypothetical protein ANO14919_116560 [Xylariales sp. No.14919]